MQASYACCGSETVDGVIRTSVAGPTAPDFGNGRHPGDRLQIKERNREQNGPLNAQAKLWKGGGRNDEAWLAI
ncbi:MAG: hypothetical protein Kow0040_28780 [Thermogutta sp.]